jgi:nitroreductase
MIRREAASLGSDSLLKGEAMETLAAIAMRHSTREFLGKPIPRDVIEKIIDAGSQAPTARNEQPWEFVVVTDAGMRKQIGELTDYGKFIVGAPVCVAVFCKDTKYYLEDGCAATENILLAATALGVQSCWVAGDKKAFCPRIAQMLKVPGGYKLISLLAMGYEATPGRQKARRGIGQVLHWEQF